MENNNYDQINRYNTSDGRVIEIGSEILEMLPPIINYYYIIEGKTHNINKNDIYDLLTMKYGIDENLVKHYKVNEERNYYNNYCIII